MSRTVNQYKVTLNNGEAPKTVKADGVYTDQGWMYFNVTGIPHYIVPSHTVCEVEIVEAKK